MKTVCNRKVTGLLTFFDRKNPDFRNERIFIRRALYTLNDRNTLMYVSENSNVPSYYTDHNLILKNYSL